MHQIGHAQTDLGSVFREATPPWQPAGIIDAHPTSATSILDLPSEVLQCIANELYLDSGTWACKDQRLVCKAFNSIFAPIVLSSLHIFSNTATETKLFEDQFRFLTSNPNLTSYVKSIDLGAWNWVFNPCEEIHSPQQTKQPLWRTLLAPPTASLTAKGSSRRIQEENRRREIQRYLEDVSFLLPNVQCVKWLVIPYECRQSMRLNSELIASLPSLTELVLTLPLNLHSDFSPFGHDFESEIVPIIAQLRNLRKIVVRIWAGNGGREDAFDWLKGIIGNSPNLNHLVVHLSGAKVPTLTNLSQLLTYVPPERPLELQTLLISSQLRLTSMVVPHIRQLNSLQVAFPCTGETHSMDYIWDILRRERIYVSEIQTNRITSPLLDYLCDFSHLTDLTLYGVGKTDPERHIPQLFQVLLQHTVRRIAFRPFDWRQWFQPLTSRESMTKLTHLREVVLHSGDQSEYEIGLSSWTLLALDALMLIVDPVSQSEIPATVIMEGNVILFQQFRDRCWASSSPSVRAIGQRMKHRNGVYDAWEHYYWTIS